MGSFFLALCLLLKRKIESIWLIPRTKLCSFACCWGVEVSTNCMGMDILPECGHASDQRSNLIQNSVLIARTRKKLNVATYNISSLKIYCVHSVLYYIYAIWNIHHSENLNDLRNFEYKDFQKIDQNNIYKMSFIMHFTICTSQYALHRTHFLYALPYALQSMHFTVCTLHYALYTMHVTLWISQYVFHIMKFTVCISE